MESSKELIPHTVNRPDCETNYLSASSAQVECVECPSCVSSIRLRVRRYIEDAGVSGLCKCASVIIFYNFMVSCGFAEVLRGAFRNSSHIRHPLSSETGAHNSPSDTGSLTQTRLRSIYAHSVG
jgi:hypothetical protein